MSTIRKLTLPLLSALIFSKLFNACDPISIADDVDLPHVSPQLVLNAYLIPQRDTQQIYLATSLPINAYLDEYYSSLANLPNPYEVASKGIIPNAEVRLTNLQGNKSITVPFNVKKLAYTFLSTDFAIQQDASYQIEVHYKSYPSLKESFQIPSGDVPKIELQDESIASLVHIYVPQTPTRYFCVYINLRRRVNDPDTQEQNIFFVSSESSTDGKLTVRQKNFLTFEDWNLSRRKLYSAQVLEIDERTYHFFQALEANQKVQENPFASPALLQTYIKNGFGIAAGVLDYGEILNE